MKIDRVLLCTDSNPKYFGYWNTISEIWRDVFNIKPTLIFVGDESEFKKINFSCEDYIILPKIKNIPIWHVTWSLFYATKFFSNDVCMLSGIDQIPVGKKFFEEVDKQNDDKYIVGISDCYNGYSVKTLGYLNTKTNVMYPSSHHVAKGKLFEQIYNFEESWEKEIEKIDKLKNDYSFFNNPNYWGLDECYASDKIYNFQQEKILYFNLGKDWFLKNRLYLNIEACNINLLKQQFYSEITYKYFGDYSEQVKEIIKTIKENKESFKLKWSK